MKVERPALTKGALSIFTLSRFNGRAGVAARQTGPCRLSATGWHQRDPMGRCGLRSRNDNRRLFEQGDIFRARRLCCPADHAGRACDEIVLRQSTAWSARATGGEAGRALFFFRKRTHTVAPFTQSRLKGSR
jgi:hypothetical protein